MRDPLPPPKGTVTFLFTDIEGSTRLLQHLGEERYAQVLAEHHRLLRAIFQQAGGHEIDNPGDAFSVVFTTARDAVAAAIAAQRALAHHPWPEGVEVRVRMGLHTGEPTFTGTGYVGLDLHRAARISAAGHGGQVLLSQTTRHLVEQDRPQGVILRALGSHRLKDLIQPERLFQVLISDLPTDFPPLKSLDARPHNLPTQPTTLIGREQELAAVCDLLRQEAGGRLVTLTGPGGTGKTRLGLQVAAELLEVFSDGVFFVGLAPINDPGLVVGTIGQVLGVREGPGQTQAESLQEYLRDRQMLLVLDNFEQVLAAAPLVSELLAHCSRLKVLVTSRAVLHLRGEQEFPVPPLALPDLQRLPPMEALSQYAAVELFIQRALQVKPEFAVTNENAPAVAEICHRLDGLPLAIELAAARIRLFSPQALLSRLENRLKLLVGGARDLPARQQALRDTIAWSYDLLDEAHQTLFRRLSVFVGGCTLEAAEAVCPAEGDLAVDVLEGLGALVSQSLVRQEEVGGEVRFTMLETIHEYGREQLAASGEQNALRRRHAQFFLELAEIAEPEFSGARGKEWMERLRAEEANLWAVLGWSREVREVNLGLRLGNALRDYCDFSGRGEVAAELLAPLLELPEAAGRTLTKARALLTLGSFQDWIAGPKTLQESLAIFRELGDKEGIVRTLFALGWIAAEQLDYSTARRCLEECQALSRELGDKDQASVALLRLSQMARAEGDHERARALRVEGTALARAGQSSHTLAWALTLEGDEAFSQEDYDRAGTLYREAVALHREAGHQHDAALMLALLGRVAYEQGDLVTSRAYCEEGLSLHAHCWLDVQLGRVAHREGDLAGAEALIKQGMAIFVRDRETLRILECLEALAGVFASQARLERAARLLGAAAPLREAFSTPMSPADRREYDRNVARVRAQLREAAFGAAWTQGRAMKLEEAVCVALEECEIPIPDRNSSKEILGSSGSPEREC
jgi:predicted ATPase/class 3 adenylate cyclase